MGYIYTYIYICIYIYIYMYTQQNLIYLFSPCKCTRNGVAVKQWNTTGYNGYCILRIVYKETSQLKYGHTQFHEPQTWGWFMALGLPH